MGAKIEKKLFEIGCENRCKLDARKRDATNTTNVPKWRQNVSPNREKVNQKRGPKIDAKKGRMPGGSAVCGGHPLKTNHLSSSRFSSRVSSRLGIFSRLRTSCTFARFLHLPTRLLFSSIVMYRLVFWSRRGIFSQLRSGRLVSSQTYIFVTYFTSPLTFYIMSS